MANLDLFYAYKETRLDLDPATQGSTIAIRLPSQGASTYSTRTPQRRSQIVDVPLAEDENTFRLRHLASASSIYYRPHHKSPRSFLWRILEDGKVLSIRSVDISKPRNLPDTNLTLRLYFPNRILPSCIAFSDSTEHDVLSAFILTETRQLYTLNLRPDHFRRPSSTEDNVGDWCKLFNSPGLNLKAGHRLVALSADEVVVSYVDGGLLKLSKAPGSDGSAWKDTHYNEGSWSLRGILQKRDMIQYNKYNYSLSAATSIASPLTIIDGTQYVFTVCLDHRLRIWNFSSGKIACMVDILNQELDPQESSKQVIQPSYSQLIKVYGNNEESAICVTYSPLGTGQFKFWNATPAADGQLNVADMFPNNTLEPQTPTSEMWTLADFAFSVDRTGMKGFTVWTLWKSNISYRAQKLEFQAGSVARMREKWRSGWMAMATETLLETLPPRILASDSSDTTDKWLKFILSPGRYSRATIETGLAIYERGVGTPKELAHGSGTLPERMCSSIASTASLSRKSDGSMDYEQFRAATDTQWRRFHRLLNEIHAQRGEALSLVLDPQGELPWIILADGVTAIRECSNLERIWHNSNRVPQGTDHVARPILAGATFRESVSDQFLYNCRSSLLGEMFEEPSLTDPMRMQHFYAKCDFANQIGDDEYSQLQADLDGTFKNLTPRVYEAMLQVLTGSDQFDRRPQLLPLAEYGNKLVVRGVQEILELHRNVCLDQLIVLILIEAEINHGEEGLDFETAAFFSLLITMLKRLELISWLASTQISLPLKRERSNSLTENPSSPKSTAPILETITVLEGVLRHLFGLDLKRDETLPAAITEVTVQICAPDSEYETFPSAIQCFLLKHGRVDLAMDFSRFAGRDPFSTYIQGRACLLANDPLAAALLFKKAAFGMAYPDPKKPSGHSSAGYLDETEKRLLNAGLPEYYSHIVSLYDNDKIYSFVIDFARLSLQFTKADDVDVSQLRTEMLSRMFNAAIQTTQYEVAHSVLALSTNSALQYSSLRTLVLKMCETTHTSQLINLPFIGLQDNVDEILAQKCQAIVDINAGLQYHKILYAWRINRSDYRGAAAISLDRLHKLQDHGDGDKIMGDDGLETPITRQYVALINALSCVEPKQAWILAEESSTSPLTKGAKPKRIVLTLEDIRRDYQEELDRIAAIQNNQFAFVGGDEMDVL